MAGLLLADSPYLSDRLVGFLGAHPLRGVGVSEAPAHGSIVRRLLVEVGLPGNISGWRHVITAVVLIDGIFAVTLALLGQVARPKVGALSD
jgi:hypothetical protein